MIPYAEHLRSRITQMLHIKVRKLSFMSIFKKTFFSFPHLTGSSLSSETSLTCAQSSQRSMKSQTIWIQFFLFLLIVFILLSIKRSLETIERDCQSLQRVWSRYAEGQCFMHDSKVSLPNSDIAKNEQNLPTYNLGEFTQYFTPRRQAQVREFSCYSGWDWAEEQTWLKHANRLPLEFGATRDDGDGGTGGQHAPQKGWNWRT